MTDPTDLDALDRWLAEHLMGWTPDPRDQDYWLDAEGIIHYKVNAASQKCPAWRPTRDIRQALEEVVPAMRERGWLLTLLEMHDGTWVARFDPDPDQGPGPHDRSLRVHTPLPAEAICIAAQKALEDGDE